MQFDSSFFRAKRPKFGCFPSLVSRGRMHVSVLSHEPLRNDRPVLADSARQPTGVGSPFSKDFWMSERACHVSSQLLCPFYQCYRNEVVGSVCCKVMSMTMVVHSLECFLRDHSTPSGPGIGC